uniref:Myosin motor domain-containing protein n=1 Tax=Wuchereria bancrofti TaxID=6293 RepID=A0A1I8EM72_WUCBA
MPSKLVRLDPCLFCKCLFHALGLNKTDFKLGLTKVFFRPGKFAEFDQMLRQDPAYMEGLVKKVQIWLLHVYWKKIQYGVLSCIKLKNKILWRAAQLTKIQSALRGYLVRKIYYPRLHLYRRTNVLWERVVELEKMLAHLSSFSQSKWSSVINRINTETQQLLRDIKFARDEQKKIEEMEEKQRLEMEKERRKWEEQKLEQQRIERKTRLEEEKRKQEENYCQQQEILKAENECEEKIKDQKNEELKQELDVEIVRRLAVEDSALQIIENNASKKEMNTGTSKYNLTKYKYVELRDIINTSTDTNLLLACKEEFHKRLQIYQQWKELNESNITEWQISRVPMAILASSSKGFSPHFSQNNVNIQRYFKVPFAKPAREHMNMRDILEVTAVSHGMWYAHFDGQWVVRQMELHPNKKPVLLLAGRDDMEMCELSLDATQLTRKKGAEITAIEFETLWHQCGGSIYHIRPRHEINVYKPASNLSRYSCSISSSDNLLFCVKLA